jgi:hypothetical protein
MDAYSNGREPCTAATATAANALTISGRSLTHRHKSETERVAEAIAILNGSLGVHDPCLLQVARLCNVPPHKIRAEQKRIAAGQCDLLDRALAEVLAKIGDADIEVGRLVDLVFAKYPNAVAAAFDRYTQPGFSVAAETTTTT